MIKVFIKKLIIVFIAMFLIFSMYATVMAGSTGDPFASLITEIDAGEDQTNISTKVQGRFGAIVNVIKIAAICVAIVMLLALAMKYMVAAPSEKAEIKKSATVYVVGAIVLFGVSGILAIIESFSTVIQSSGGNT